MGKGYLRRRRLPGDTDYEDNYGDIFGEKKPWWMKDDADEPETEKGSAQTKQTELPLEDESSAVYERVNDD